VVPDQAVTKSIGTILVGEIGASDTRLALCGLDMGRPTVVLEERLPNRDFVGLGPLVRQFLQKYRPPPARSASFVVTGPVHEGVCLAANVPWPLDREALRAELGIDRVILLNDVEAMAHGIPALTREDLLPLVPGDAAAQEGNLAILSAGACPGVAGAYWNGTEHVPFVSDGAHADFAPSCEEELHLALHLTAEVARVTVELLLSSSGLALIYRYLRSRSDAEPVALSEALRSEDAADVIMRETDPVCQQAVLRFLTIFGSAAGNLALTLRATGGVYLGGSITGKLRERLKGSAFQAAFARKPPMQSLLANVPVHAIVSDRAALLGAATVAARELRTHRGGGWAS
jgi:glucokinase